VIVIILRKYKFYHFRTPRWFFTEEKSGDWLYPNYPLVLLENILGEIAYIYGYYIYASEESEFELFWRYGTELRRINISLPGPGTVMYANTIPINFDSPHTEGSFGLVIVNQPSSGSTYQAGILASGCRWSQL
jgi:hypothetical protein